jgi:hypothetical protein
VEVRRLEADEGTEQVQCLYAMLLLQEEVVECEEQDLEELVKAAVYWVACKTPPLASFAQRRPGQIRAHGPQTRSLATRRLRARKAHWSSPGMRRVSSW